MIDIGSENSDIEKKLSNFSEFHFIFDGVKCQSMEGLLQSFKFPDVEKQKRVCSLVGKKAKFKGKKKKWYLDHKLYWKEQVYDRFSFEYQELLDKAFSNLYHQNKDYKELILSTGEQLLIHSIGKNDPKHTILTEEEFCSRIDKLRKGLL